MDQQEEIKQPSTDPVYETKRDEPESGSDWLDAAHPHDHEDDEGDEPRDCREHVLLDPFPEAGVDGEAEGAEVSEEVDTGPEEEPDGHSNVEQQGILERKYL